MAYETDTDRLGTTQQAVVGLFNDANDAHEAVTQLKANGFSSRQIGAAFRSGATDRYLDPADAGATRTGAVAHRAESWWDKVKDAFRSEDESETRRDDVSANSTTRSESYAPSEHEYDFAGDDFEGSLAGIGIPADRAAYLSRNLQPGGAIVTVRDTDRAAEAEQILSANHGNVRYEDAAGANVGGSPGASPDYRGTVSAGMDAPAWTGQANTDTGHAERRPLDAENASANPAGDRIQLFGEVLRVHKDRISRGEVRVRKDVVTENQTIEVPVTREEFVLERVSVAPGTPASSANIGRSQEIRVPLSEETVRVEKEPVVREEVLVGKREVSDVTRLEDDVRHEELRVDSDVDTSKRTATGEALPEDVRRRG